jgi:hypothetical protein
MDQGDQKRKVSNTEEISFRDLVDKIKSGIRYIKTKWFTILIVSMLCALLGLSYSIIKKPNYTAVCTFVLEDSKGGGLGQYAGLASLAGINIGGGGGSGNGIFEGDNILELYKSRSMIEKTLLSVSNFNGKKELLIDRYIASYKLRDKWKGDDQIGDISFNGDANHFNRKQDSIITSLVDLFNKITLNVTKPDKKLSIIKVEVTTKDEFFSKAFTENLVQTVNEFYVQTKTKKAYQNVQVLQHQADSVRVILNSSLNGVASATDAAPNANPLMSTLRVNSQKRQIDVQANTAIYGEVVKNLELEKISLRQDTPLIQVIDKPVLPLIIDKIGKIKGLIMGFIIGVILTIGLLIGKKLSEQF